MITLLGIRLG